MPSLLLLPLISSLLGPCVERCWEVCYMESLFYMLGRVANGRGKIAGVAFMTWLSRGHGEELGREQLRR